MSGMPSLLFALIAALLTATAVAERRGGGAADAVAHLMCPSDAALTGCRPGEPAAMFGGVLLAKLPSPVPADAWLAEGVGGYAGTVPVVFSVGLDGRPFNVRLNKTPRLGVLLMRGARRAGLQTVRAYEQAALKAVAEWRFSHPLRLNGAPSIVHGVRLRVPFGEGL